MSTLLMLLPLVILVVGALVILLVDALFRSPGKKAGSFIRPVHAEKVAPEAAAASGTRWTLERSAASAVLLAVSFFLTLIFMLKGYAGAAGSGIGSSLRFDNLAMVGWLLISGGGFFACLMAGGYFHELKADEGGFLPLVLLASAGAMVLVSAADLITFFVGLETMSLAAYAMTGFRVLSPRSIEGGMKYFLLGSFASAILLYGMALLYGATGSVEIDIIGRLLTGETARKPLVVLGSLMVLTGLVFKVAAVPFHMWTPEAYQGAPTPATGFMATVVKAAAFVALVRIVGTALRDPALAGPPFGWASLLSVVCVVTMFWGNLAALRQKNIKRMLAYSSIAHAGYILVGVVAGWVFPAAAGRAEWSMPPLVSASIVYYLAAYIAANAGAFAVISMACRNGNEATDIEDYRGFGRRHPMLALALSICLLSMLGMPPLGGFFGKLYVFRIAVEGNLWLLAVLGMIASVVSAYYYIGVIVTMYMKEREEGAEGASPISSYQMAAAVILAVLLVLALGLYPSPVLSLIVG
jgi:NADH-quinone oxidoreductase subunit N